ncbi:hypothetical protein ACFRFH_11970 [Leifsonia sp. NPDC056824]|uniref:hypothetical protein n=1 Tax=Leifsonia sp. NPDC056824 TaxID=3345953 RepID=UPI0036C12EC0
MSALEWVLVVYWWAAIIFGGVGALWYYRTKPRTEEEIRRSFRRAVWRATTMRWVCIVGAILAVEIALVTRDYWLLAYVLAAVSWYWSTFSWVRSAASWRDHRLMMLDMDRKLESLKQTIRFANGGITINGGGTINNIKITGGGS